MGDPASASSAGEVCPGDVAGGVATTMAASLDDARSGAGSLAEGAHEGRAAGAPLRGGSDDGAGERWLVIGVVVVRIASRTAVAMASAMTPTRIQAAVSPTA